MNHKKPTSEELEESIKKAQEELETPIQTEPIEETPEETPVVEETPVEETPEVVETPIPSPDYKEKYVGSTREAQVLASKNKKLTTVIEDASKIPEPTDDEMLKEYTEWDIMDSTSKKMARDVVWNRKRFDVIDNINKEFKDIDSWNEKVDKYIDDPKTLMDNPKLEGYADEFKIFATKQSRRGVDFEDLVSSFLYKRESDKVPKKSQMFPTGSGGPNDRPKAKAGKISIADAAILQKNDYKKWVSYLKEDKIESFEG